MDIELIENLGRVRVSPRSIHGVLWLQTHFAESMWDKMMTGNCWVTVIHADDLSQDARLAGLSVSLARRWES